MLDKYLEKDTKEIYIPEKDWEELNKKYTRDEISEAFIEHILAGDIRLPTKAITLEEAKTDFLDMKYSESESNFHKGEWFSRGEYTYPLGNEYLSCGTLGSKASNYFQQDNRYECGHRTCKSPKEVWSSRRDLKSILKALWTLHCTEIDIDDLQACIRLRKYVASQFKPMIAKTIYDHFKAESVCDFSMGWGDRLCGFYGSGAKFYFGTDPNTKVFETYKKQIEFYNSLIRKPKKTEIHNLPAEDVDFGKERFDLCFTSPPYFKAEEYSKEETQSYLRYDTSDAWLDGFLLTVISKVWTALKPNGILALNIADIYGHAFCDKMNDYIKHLGGKEYSCIGMRMSKRPNSNADDDGTFCEPIWIWRKEGSGHKENSFW